jgi:hypothetical protein
MTTASIDSDLNALNLISWYQPGKQNLIEVGLNKLQDNGARISGNLDSADLSKKISNLFQKNAQKVNNATWTLQAVDNRLSDAMDLVISMHFLAQKGMTEYGASHSDQIEFNMLKNDLYQMIGQPSQGSNMTLNGTLDSIKLIKAGISNCDAAAIGADYSSSGLGLDQLDISNPSDAESASLALSLALDKLINGRLITRSYLAGESQPDPKMTDIQSANNFATANNQVDAAQKQTLWQSSVVTMAQTNNAPQTLLSLMM